MAGGYLRFNGSYLKQLPIKIPKEMELEKLMIKLCDYLLFLNQMKINSSSYEDSINENKQLKYFSNLADYLVLELYFEDKFSHSLFTELSEMITSINYENWLEFYFDKNKKDEKEKLEINIIRKISNSYNSIKKSSKIKLITDEILADKEFRRLLN